ncbi:uncharacterized protein MELLADRAFT_102681 [Melampsora larici-populina 98AG31]|uniref:Uncharacterized protein n=1 Tax=Melampsora larici-populina (strain 98AG31 / pathotype 3-4-7) TaxID=747676 RepID=F4R919_MELLP|nr:uncharacterized protein MELLADRAFT_102681 [Melampsora larici-populina 98AG31]EGG10910.1 hypothetical protein MELLADRAFT_102681 [Melampsora larici-populina 98AG31]
MPKPKHPSDENQATLKSFHSTTNHHETLPIPNNSNLKPHHPLDSNQSPSTDEIDGADPNASIRPLTPSSKAVSTRSPNQHRSSSEALSPTNDLDLQSQPRSASPLQFTPESPISERRPRQHGSLSSLRSHSTRYASSFDHHHHNHSGGHAADDHDDGLSAFGNGSLASTKPTTVVSLETTAGANRIALASPPLIPSASTLTRTGSNRANNINPASSSTMAQPATNRLHSRAIANHHHQRLQSSSSLVAPVTPTVLTIPSSSPPSETSSPVYFDHLQSYPGIVPKHTLPHPSQNPHPAALADNASMLTLASSGFAPSIHAIQNFPPDEDASVRALAPSRRESTESLSSRWSGAVLSRASMKTNGGQSIGPGFFLGGGGSVGRGGGTSSVGGVKSLCGGDEDDELGEGISTDEEIVKVEDSVEEELMKNEDVLNHEELVRDEEVVRDGEVVKDGQANGREIEPLEGSVVEDEGKGAEVDKTIKVEKEVE